MISEVQGQDCEWGEDYRAAGRAALVEILDGQMALRVDRHLEEMARRGQVDRRDIFKQNRSTALAGWRQLAASEPWLPAFGDPFSLA